MNDYMECLNCKNIIETGKIVYKRGAFFVCYFDYYADGDEELICDAQVEFGTVIGNVYENKELLEG